MNIKKIKSLVISTILIITMTGCTNKNETIAKVNDKTITLDYYEKTLNLQKQALENMYGKEMWDEEIAEGITFGDRFKEETLMQIVNVEAIKEQATKEGIKPTEEEINEKVEEINELMKASEEFKNNLDKIGIDEEYIKNQQIQDLTISKYREKLEKEIKVSDTEAKKYYEENKSDYYIDEVEASHILISTLDENEEPLGDKEKEEAKKKAHDLLKRINDGEDFSELATKHSEDPGSGAKGGELGYFGKGQMVPEFEKAAYDLEIGEVSDVVESEFGYHIIKVTDKNQEQTPFEKVIDSVKLEITDKQINEKINDIISSANIDVEKDLLKKIKL